MLQPNDISESIVEALYCEALVLADEVRATFDIAPLGDPGESHAQLRVAMSAEGLKTTTRMMHLLAWLLNHRAYFAGDLSAFQLSRHGVLPPDRAPDPGNLALFEAETLALIDETVRLHARIVRLDHAWHERFERRRAPVQRLQRRLDQAVERLPLNR